MYQLSIENLLYNIQEQRSNVNKKERIAKFQLVIQVIGFLQARIPSIQVIGLYRHAFLSFKLSAFYRRAFLPFKSSKFHLLIQVIDFSQVRIPSIQVIGLLQARIPFIYLIYTLNSHDDQNIKNILLFKYTIYDI